MFYNHMVTDKLALRKTEGRGVKTTTSRTAFWYGVVHPLEIRLLTPVDVRQKLRIFYSVFSYIVHFSNVETIVTRESEIID